MRPIAAYDFTFINVTTFDNVDVRHVLCEQHVDLFLAKRDSVSSSHGFGSLCPRASLGSTRIFSKTLRAFFFWAFHFLEAPELPMPCIVLAVVGSREREIATSKLPTKLK